MYVKGHGQGQKSKVKVKGQRSSSKVKGQVLYENPLKSHILRWGQGQGQGQRLRSRSRSNSFQNHTNQLFKNFGRPYGRIWLYLEIQTSDQILTQTSA